MTEIERVNSAPLPMVPVPDRAVYAVDVHEAALPETTDPETADLGSALPERPSPEAHGPGRALEPEGVPEILARLRRAHGQLGGVIHMIETDRSCQDVVTQLSAVAKAVQRAGFAVITQGMQQCLTDPGASDVDLDEMEKLFLRLA